MAMTPFRMNPAYGKPLGQVLRESDFLREYVPAGQKPAKGKYQLIGALPSGVEVAVATSRHEGGGAALVVHTPANVKRPPMYAERNDEVMMNLHHHEAGYSDLELTPGWYRVVVGDHTIWFTLKK